MVWLLAGGGLIGTAEAVLPGGVLLVVPSRWATSWMESAGWVWSFWMVPVAADLACVALVGPDRVNVTGSSGCNAVSAHCSTVSGLLRSPGAKVFVVLLWLIYSELHFSLHDALPISIAVTLPVA